MADLYATINEVETSIQEQLADVLELRAAEAQQRAMLDDYLREIPLRDDARVLELGCGTGAVSRRLAELPAVAEVVGVDPSQVFVERARELGAGSDKLRFAVGDARSLEFDDCSFDAVFLHTVLSHVPEPERAIAEARRVTTEGGSLAAFDGDYATTTVAISAADPLQACAEAAMAALVHDRHLVRRLPALVRAAGWDVLGVRSHGYVETDRPSYMLTLVDRGADALVAAGELGEPGATALKEEARRRVTEGRFFGHIAYASVIARAA